MTDEQIDRAMVAYAKSQVLAFTKYLEKNEIKPYDMKKDSWYNQQTNEELTFDEVYEQFEKSQQ